MNPLIQSIENELPKFNSIDAENHIRPAINQNLTVMLDQFQQLEEQVQHKKITNFDQIIGNLEKMRFPVEYMWGIVNHLNGVCSSDPLRQAKLEMQPKIIDAFMKFGQSKIIYQAIEQLSQTTDDPIEKRVLYLTLRDFKMSGIGLEEDKQVRFNQIQKRLSELSSKFSNNILDSTKLFKRQLTQTELENVPDSIKRIWFQDGKYIVTLDGPSYVSAMKHLPLSKTREEIYKAYITRAAEENEPIANEIFKLRQEKAELLGYNNYAEVSLEAKMAKTVTKVENMIDTLYQKSASAAQNEMDQIKAFARSQNFDQMNAWDVPYYSERLKESKFNFNEEELKPYFAFPNVLKGLFGLARRLFGIKIVQREKGVEVWDPSVLFFDIMEDSTGEKVASFYLDPFTRPENKRGGAWMDDCVGKSKFLGNNPIAYLTCNGTKPIPEENKPSLMTFREVETLFHEFGHGLQHMLTKIDIGDIAGINGIEWDAVELPSQFMENWCYDRKTLNSMAIHYQTNELLPEELYQKLLAIKTYNSGMAMMRQLYFAQLDMELHTRYAPEDTLWSVQQRVAAKFCCHNPIIPEDKFLCGFHHIFSSYAAGYYSYKWAEMMSADAFGAFEEAAEDDYQILGRRFRNTVLALGGSKDPSQVYRMFRGRDPNVDALLRHSNL